MSNLEELRNWVELELKEAKHNLQQSRNAPEGLYHKYNTGREVSLRRILDKIDVLIALEESGPGEEL